MVKNLSEMSGGRAERRPGVYSEGVVLHTQYHGPTASLSAVFHFLNGESICNSSVVAVTAQGRGGQLVARAASVCGTWQIGEGTTQRAESGKQSKRSGREHGAGSRKSSSRSGEAKGLEWHLKRAWG